MTTIPSHLSSVGPSPSRNPFARPKLGGTSSCSFTRKTLLPSILSPDKSTSTDSASASSDNLVTPLSKSKDVLLGGAGAIHTPRSRTAWRLLWRGGLEIGNEGFRLDGITFFALLSFSPATPSTAATKEINPFDVPIQSTPGIRSALGASTPGGSSAGPQSPFPLTNGDTDLCLSLESMRGRKYLQVRGTIDLPPDEVLEGESDENGNTIHMSISPQAPLLAAYFTGLLCRNEKLNQNGRTLSAILIGLGDEGVDPSSNSTILVYGQRQEQVISSIAQNQGQGQGQATLKLCVGRRKLLLPQTNATNASKVKPGEPLPRAPLFFPAKAPKKPLPLFPSRSFSRTSSVSSSIYQHPQPQAHSQAPSHPSHPQQHPHSHSQHDHQRIRSSSSSSQLDLMSRIEKRARESDPPEGDFDKRRKVGNNALEPSRPLNAKSERVLSHSTSHEEVNKRAGVEEEEDIFGHRGKSITPVPSLMSRTKSKESTGELTTSEKALSDVDIANGEGGGTSSSRNKRVRVPQQVLDNKAAIRKQTLVLLEQRSIPRTHELFKDVFGMTTKGTYFAFRDRLHLDLIPKDVVHRIINVHLDMYLPQRVEPQEMLLAIDNGHSNTTTNQEAEMDPIANADAGKESTSTPAPSLEVGAMVRQGINYNYEHEHEGEYEHEHVQEYESRIKLDSVIEEEDEN
uniref:Sld7 C-terminal domain-containing protein n=1 Tax=Kwoniella dejecticola CBS 10117 TaxID=1296121 RepID=A0A1A6AAH8_9TREE|nr:uncharacterized protein I303_03091 [Kwoniella dejecticola CBS 10117]OBR87068.1 hypothetical protein I303_03091 [Kwoniella dejecticola CBS 10117]